MMTAAVASSFLVLPDPADRVLLGVARTAVDVGHHRDAGLEAGQAERQLGEHQQRHRDHHDRVAVLLGEGRAVQSPITCGLSNTCQNADPDDDDVEREVDDDQGDRRRRSPR